MFKLISATIDRYKSYKIKQDIEIDRDITVLVGKNESGKSAFLEALFKSKNSNGNKFSPLHDLTRSEIKNLREKENELVVVICEYEIDDDTIKLIESNHGIGVFPNKIVKRTVDAENNFSWINIDSSENIFIKYLIHSNNLSKEYSKIIEEAGSITNILRADYIHSEEELNIKKILVNIVHEYCSYKFGNKSPSLEIFEKIYKNEREKINDIIEKIEIPSNILDYFIASKYLEPHTPEFCYLNDFAMLPTDINLNSRRDDRFRNLKFDTVDALVELLSIDIDNLKELGNHESVTANFEIASRELTNMVSSYWSPNHNYSIDIRVHNVELMYHSPKDTKQISVRVKNKIDEVNLPLENLSRGFQCFLYFLIWFSWINQCKKGKVIILMDEPGLHLHASAQADLLKCIEDQAKIHQVIYTTHSPFMVKPNSLHRVRTVFESEGNSIISSAIHKNDPSSLFPLQDAFGYNVSQLLFIAKSNLLVEGNSDYIFLSIMSEYLIRIERQGLRPDISIVPMGGCDKVCAFISLLRGSELEIACLLDSSSHNKGKKRLKQLIDEEIISDEKIIYINKLIEPAPSDADIEDLFTKDEYIRVFNDAFEDIDDINVEDLNSDIPTINLQIQKFLTKISKKDTVFHQKVANHMSKTGAEAINFSKETISRFEKLFLIINKLFQTNNS